MGDLSIINILVATNSLKTYGGTESYTFTIIEELVKRDINVEYFTFHKGIFSDKIENELGVKFMSKTNYSLIIANHRTCIEKLFDRGFIIQTCHGVFPRLEQPSFFADKHVSISEEVFNHLKAKGFVSEIIRNGINCERFFAKNQIGNQAKTILSLCHGLSANEKLKIACNKLGISLIQQSKYKNGIWNIEELINRCDLVIGIGRSAIEAMACGRPTIIFDSRKYMEEYSDGYAYDVLDQIKACNFSGRYFKYNVDISLLINEINKYNQSHSQYLTKYVSLNLNIKNKIESYLSIKKEISVNFTENTTRIIIQIWKKSFGKKSLKICLNFAKLVTPKWIKQAYSQ